MTMKNIFFGGSCSIEVKDGATEKQISYLKQMHPGADVFTTTDKENNERKERLIVLMKDKRKAEEIIKDIRE